MVTGIGSLPFRDVDHAIDLIFETCPSIPFWPQLPKRSPLENMYAPFVVGSPFFEVNGEGKVTVTPIEDLERFSLEDLEEIAIPEDYALGFHRFLERIRELEGVKAVKTQITGPVSLGLGIRDQKGLPIIYDSTLFEALKKTVNLKAKWMINEIRRVFPEGEIILFFDEPYLVAYGTAYFTYPEEGILSAVSEAKEKLNVSCGIHCCGNTDWSIVLRMGLDIVNYDAKNYLESIFLYEDELRSFLGGGGVLSPGVVPSTEDINCTENQDIVRILSDFFRKLSKFESFPKRILITPSCGLGNLTEKEAVKAMRLLSKIPEILPDFFDKEPPSW